MFFHWAGAKRLSGPNGCNNMMGKILFEQFPKDITTFIDIFIGSGCVAFEAAKLYKYVITNDLNNDIHNFYNIYMTRRQELIDLIEITPYHESIFKDFKNYKQEKDELLRALKFVYVYNYGFINNSTMRHALVSNAKTNLINRLKDILTPANIQFLNCDFRKVLKKISFHIARPNQKKRAFVYADPPYLDVSNAYGFKWQEKDFQDLVDLLIDSEIRFAISEFDNPKVIEYAKSKRLNIVNLCNRRNLGNHRNEILITNYQEKGDLWTST